MTGPDFSLAELTVQFAWLGAACRTSPNENEIASCSTDVTAEENFNLTFKITFSLEKIVKEDQLEGSCWYLLFRNPVIVQGFPSLNRPNREKGLDIPFDMMIGLGMTERATTFDGCLVLKGFSTIFIPTNRTRYSIQWHFIRSLDNDYLSYREAAKSCPTRSLIGSIDEGTLGRTRNFVGWASSVLVQAGEHVFLCYQFVVSWYDN